MSSDNSWGIPVIDLAEVSADPALGYDYKPSRALVGLAAVTVIAVVLELLARSVINLYKVFPKLGLSPRPRLADLNLRSWSAHTASRLSIGVPDLRSLHQVAVGH
jgi:hypothetical protein